MRTIRNMLFLLLSSAVLGTVLMIMVYALPVRGMRENVSSSIDIMIQQGNYYSWAGFSVPFSHATYSGAPSMKEKFARWKPFSILDYTTDMCRLNTAVYSSNKKNTLIYDAMMNHNVRYETSGVSMDKAEVLSRVLTNETNEGGYVASYARYWHGYLIYLKPLLMFLSVPVIRMINFALQLLLMTMIVMKMFSKIGKTYAFAFVLAVLVIDPVAAALCFSYSDVYYIMLATMIVMLNCNDVLKKGGGYCILFAACGILTAYFDLLSYPFVSLGIPTVLYLIMNDSDKLSEKISAMIKTGLSWGFGYSGMWVGKWVISSLITGNNVIQNAMNAASYRINGSWQGAKVTWYEKLQKVFSYLSTLHTFWVIAIILCIVAALIVLYLYMSISKGKTTVAEIIPLCFAFLYPFVWYAVLQNHSIIHFSLFTHKLLSISVFAASCILIKCSGYKRNG